MHLPIKESKHSTLWALSRYEKLNDLLEEAIRKEAEAQKTKGQAEASGIERLMGTSEFQEARSAFPLLLRYNMLVSLYSFVEHELYRICERFLVSVSAKEFKAKRNQLVGCEVLKDMEEYHAEALITHIDETLWKWGAAEQKEKLRWDQNKVLNLVRTSCGNVPHFLKKQGEHDFYRTVRNCIVHNYGYVEDHHVEKYHNTLKNLDAAPDLCIEQSTQRLRLGDRLIPELFKKLRDMFKRLYDGICEKQIRNGS